ncbi:MAG: hypothetical protein ACI9XR_000746 [Flavobacterium sp.]|jgi:hypothetical protein
MESNNIENQIKQKLANREIQPSGQTWDRLDAMLTVAEEKKSKKVLFWNPKYFTIAAAFVLIGTLVFINFSENNITISTPENTVVIKENTENEKQDSYDAEIVVAPTESVIVEKSVAVVKTLEKSESNKNTKTPIINQKTNVILKSNPSTNSEIASIEKNVNSKEQELIFAKTKVISDSDLLASIDKASKTNNSKTIQVSSRSLLYEVTSEINQEYRETNFQKLKRNFETVKVAISNRNIK